MQSDAGLAPSPARGPGSRFFSTRFSNRKTRLPSCLFCVSEGLCCRLACLFLAFAGALPAESRINPKDGVAYQWIPSGNFMMGCSPDDRFCEDSEKPAHRVKLTAGFWMADTPVTVAAWKKYRKSTGAPPLPSADGLGRKDLNEASPDETIPVVFVTWSEANAFCGWADMRLPTEAEWEYAARAGTISDRYGGLDQIAWYGDNTGRRPIDSSAVFQSDRKNYFQHLYDNGNRPQPTARKTANAWGLHDMLGDVWEWVADWYGERYYTDAAAIDPAGPPAGMQRVLRGGSWYNFPVLVRVSTRGASVPEGRLAINGFRCAGNKI